MLDTLSNSEKSWLLIMNDGAEQFWTSWNMFDELLEKMKVESFNVKEIVTDKDSSENPIFCNYLQEMVFTECSRHSAKTLHES